MTVNRLFSVRAQLCSILFTAGLVLAASQNVTVDDAALTGAWLPIYLPSEYWNQGNNCSTCYAKPNASLAYDGTWHDTTLFPLTTYFPTFEFLFVGNGLYIYFILANTVPNTSTLTNVQFILDGVRVASFQHVPTTSSDYEYNQTVYANSSIPYGQHNMTVAPVNDMMNNVLMLFDYLIYTTETSSSSTSLSQSPSATSSVRTSSPPNIGTIVGGTVAGVGALILVVTSVICYRRHKRRTGARSASSSADVVAPFIFSPEPSSRDTLSAMQAAPTGSSPSVPRSGYKVPACVPSTTAQPPIPLTTLSQTSSDVLPSGSTPGILEQVEMLRNEVANLRRLQDLGGDILVLGAEPPPEYSTGPP